MQAPAAGWAGGGRACGWGAERHLLNTLPLGLANSLAWKKLLENEMWEPVPKMGWEVAERLKRGWCLLLGVMIPAGWGLCRVGLKEGEQEAGTQDPGESWPSAGEAKLQKRSPQTVSKHGFCDVPVGRKPPQERAKDGNIHFGAQRPRV
jgi:hypothetical protein